MTILGDKIRNTRQAKDLSQMQLARAVGCPQSVIDRVEKGQTKLSKHLPSILAFLGLSDDTQITISVVGYVGAGAEVHPIDDHAKGASLEEIPAPPGVLVGIALIVRGESMWPRYVDGDIVILEKSQIGLDSLVGKTCYVMLPDGRALLKVIQHNSRPGHWNLISHNAPPIEGVVIERAYPVAWVKPRG